MNRRTALLTSMFLGGLVPRSLLAQGQGPQARASATRPPSCPRPTADDASPALADSDLPALFPTEPGYRVQEVGHLAVHPHPRPPGSPREGLDRLDLPPDRHLRLARGPRPPHSGPTGASSAPTIRRKSSSRSTISSSGSSTPTEDMLSVHVQFIAAVDPRWRYTVYSRLTYVGGGRRASRSGR